MDVYEMLLPISAGHHNDEKNSHDFNKRHNLKKKHFSLLQLILHIGIVILMLLREHYSYEMGLKFL